MFVPQRPTSEPVSVNWRLSVKSNRLWIGLHHLLTRESYNSFNRQLAGEAEVKHIAKPSSNRSSVQLYLNIKL